MPRIAFTTGSVITLLLIVAVSMDPAWAVPSISTWMESSPVAVPSIMLPSIVTSSVAFWSTWARMPKSISVIPLLVMVLLVMSMLPAALPLINTLTASMSTSLMLNMLPSTVARNIEPAAPLESSRTPASAPRSRVTTTCFTM